MASIEYRSLAVGPLSTNCYIIWESESKAAAIIDPGGDKNRIISLVSSLGLNVRRILLTHGHPDHTFCAGALACEFDAGVAMHEQDLPLLEDSLGLAEMFYDISELIPFTLAEYLDDGEVIDLGGSKIQVLHTPGHSQGGISFATEAGIFCGDTIFAGSIGRTDFPGGSYSQLIESIKCRILSLPDNIPLYPGHGPCTTVGKERTSNPFLAGA